MRANVLVHCRQALVRRVRVTGRLQVDRDARQTDDFIAAVIQGALMGQAPARLAAAIQMQLQLVFQHQPLLQHPPVLLGVTRPQLLREHLGAGFTQ
ncbi:hypothetical protein D3C81_1351460 [compost metagenome]